MRGALRRGDIFGRLGGVGFGVVVRNVNDREGLEQRARELLQAVAQPMNIDEREHLIGATIGIVIVGDAYRSVEEIFRAADTTIYQARSKGEHVAFYDDSMRAHVGRKAEIVPHLQRAIQQGEFSLAFQPIVDLNAATFVSFETHCFAGNIRAWDPSRRPSSFRSPKSAASWCRSGGSPWSRR